MGCDIHFYVELLGDDGKWAPQPKQIGNCEYCKGTGQDPERSSCSNCGNLEPAHDPKTKKCLFGSGKQNLTPYPCPYDCTDGKYVYEKGYSGRSYELFGVLSGVRGKAVEGFTKEDAFLPDDVSPILRKMSGYDRPSDYHSHTCYTLSELLTFDWSGRDLDHFEKTVKWMQNLHKDPDRVRAVFWYDN